MLSVASILVETFMGGPKNGYQEKKYISPLPHLVISVSEVDNPFQIL